MVYRSLTQIFEEKERVFQSLKITVLPLSLPQAGFRIANGEWTIAEVVEHLPIVESRLYRLVNVSSHKLEKSSESSPAVSDPKIGIPDGSENGDFGKVKTKAEYEPTGTASVVDSVTRLQVIHDDLHVLRPRLERIDLSAVSFDHWLLGSLTLGQWVAFIGIHEERHLRQIQSIIASPLFPDH